MSASRPAPLAVAALGAIALLAACDCRGDAAPEPSASAAEAPAPDPPPAAEVVPAEPAMPHAEFCGSCHAPVDPRRLPRARWPREIDKMLAHHGNRGKGPRPTREELVRFFVAAAPESLSYPPAPAPGGPLRFTATPGPRGPRAAGATHAEPELDADGKPVAVWVADTFGGSVARVDLASGEHRSWDGFRHPIRLARGDLDGDGRKDTVVADLGHMTDLQSRLGAVTWLRARPDGSHALQPLLQDVGRLGDLEIADVDGDGDADLVVGIFGLETPGVIVLEARPGEEPPYARRVIEQRAGVVDVEVADLDGDGREEVIAALCQEYEEIVVYQRTATGLSATPIARANDPDWGTSGITLHDLDRDGDLDLLWLNGDTMDTQVVKPDQGITLLDNRGGLRFERRSLAVSPGVHRALVADLDGDGDEDIATAAYLPWPGSYSEPLIGPERIASITWLERTADGGYKAHAIELDRAVHTDLALLDANGDGRLDLLVPEMNPEALEAWKVVDTGERDAWFTIHLNAAR